MSDPDSVTIPVPAPLTLADLVRAVMDDQQMLAELNENPAKVTMSPDGKVAELSIAEVVPPIIASTIRALADIGLITFTPTE